MEGRRTGLLAWGLCAGAAIAATLPYQGLATDAKGNPRADGDGTAKFALYQAAEGGTPVWSETQAVATRKGLFSASLGRVNDIPEDLFGGGPLYLGVALDGGAEVSPRLALGPAPSAIASRRADTARAAGVADSARRVAGLTDSLGALRAILSTHGVALGDLNAAVAAQGSRLAAKDSVGKAHLADSAKVSSGLADSVAALRLALASKDSARASRKADSSMFATRSDSGRAAWRADTARASVRADTAKVARRVVGRDSALIQADSISAWIARDSVAKLTVRVKLDSASLKAARDSIHIVDGNLRVARDSVQILTGMVAKLSASLSALSAWIAAVPWNGAIAYGSLTDARDGHVYRTVKIGAQTWMAENLAFAGSGTTVGVCYNSSADSCAKYGRLYTWTEMMQGAAASNLVPSGVQGVCPTGWHVPSDAEWGKLTDGELAPSTAGTVLKSSSGWISGSGTDAKGFRVLPGGSAYYATFDKLGSDAFIWTASEGSIDAIAWTRAFHSDFATVDRNTNGKVNRFSVRCLGN